MLYIVKLQASHESPSRSMIFRTLKLCPFSNIPPRIQGAMQKWNSHIEQNRSLELKVSVFLCFTKIILFGAIFYWRFLHPFFNRILASHIHRVLPA